MVTKGVAIKSAIQERLEEVQRAVDSAGRALEEARTAWDVALAKLAKAQTVQRKKLRERPAR